MDTYFIPKENIHNDIKKIERLKIIQLINWVLVKNKWLEEYPMVESINLNWTDFPSIKVHFYEKKPWVIILGHNDNQFVYAKDWIHII